MKEIPTWVLEKLCCYDPRNPDNTLEYLDESYENYKNAEGECFCDNCFYGRTKLAEYIIELYENNTRK